MAVQILWPLVVARNRVKQMNFLERGRKRKELEVHTTLCAYLLKPTWGGQSGQDECDGSQGRCARAKARQTDVPHNSATVRPGLRDVGCVRSTTIGLDFRLPQRSGVARNGGVGYPCKRSTNIALLVSTQQSLQITPLCRNREVRRRGIGKFLFKAR